MLGLVALAIVAGEECRKPFSLTRRKVRGWDRRRNMFRILVLARLEADVCRFSTTADIAATSSVRSALTLSADCLPRKRISHWAGTWWRIGVHTRPCAVWLRRFGLPDPQRVCLKCSNKLMRFDEIMNWRDLGSCHASLQRGLLFRSASLSGASEVS